VPIDTEDDAKNFQCELEVMSKMTHPAALSLLGYRPPSEESRVGLLVMDYMAHGTLEAINKLVYRGTPHPDWNGTAISKAIVGIVVGMCFVHSVGILHRDLKPGNIFIDEHYEIRIADFGRAVPAGPGAMTASPGTPLTQAPETYQGDVYTNKIDVYSFAVCLYAMFRQPSQLDDSPPAKTAMQLIRRLSTGARFAADPAIPDWHWTLITRCWSANPDERPTFQEILQQLTVGREWVLEGADRDAVAEYEAKVLGTVRVPEGVPQFDSERPVDTAGGAEELPPPRAEMPKWWPNCLLL
jgi:serine/threonine protein kinase